MARHDPDPNEAAGPAVLIYTTFPALQPAQETARLLVERRLVACANILPGMISIYRWAGELEQAEEVVLLLKTTAARAQAVVAEVRAFHPYEQPAVLTLPVSGGDAGYLAWIAAETRPDAE
ncbi:MULTISPECIES: divalent-cation tolerance protein CutA [unclassified Xanthobacter]|uniref:divalent-cation tolerance protein CutA n=1 Tax=unclassified Xanthobacter TaxID=2623496 RepID=UPI001EDD1EED|nr:MULTISPECIES: divalent-cation tolerance protein CutA [unclassified Xanthobacter]